MADRQATVTYYYHSGFSVAVGETLLIFDYWRGDRGQLPRRAWITDWELRKYEQVLVFVSHSHEDHYDTAIFSWDYHHLPITYILSEDLVKLPDVPKLPVDLDRQARIVAPGDRLTLGETEIRVFDSTDLGVSFYVTLDGLRIFHAGDLNLWHWREESTPREITRAENAYYAAVAPIERLPIDIAMFPVDPRMGGLYDAGANHFVMSVKPRLFIPMHWQDRPEVAQDYARKGHTKFTEILALTKPRERAELEFSEHELRIHVFTWADVTPEEEEEKADVKLDAYAPTDPFSDTDLPVQL
ncbi:MAG: MBL fold metallo-hydrolase [Clostridia bacterium]|nr:MBL fold metallo-hydrolase [Clostridia bacterium]